MRTRTRTIVAGVALVATLDGGAAWATSPDAGGAIRGCYNTGNGNLRVVESSDTCRNSETAISWDRQGLRGVGGANGADGRDGWSARAEGRVRRGRRSRRQR